MIEQGTDAWRQCRLGKVTASRVADVMAKGKDGKPSRTRANYLAQLVVERLTGVATEGFRSKEMEWGNQYEDEARDNYTFMKDAEVERCSFIEHPSIAMAGASPDSFVGKDGLLELKCPLTATHLDTLLGGSIDGGYKLQMQWQLAVTGREWCDFVSYDPRCPAHLQLSITRIPRDDAKIAELSAGIIAFLIDVERTIECLDKLRPKVAVRELLEAVG